MSMVLQPDNNLIQEFPASCAIKCQQIILRDYGFDVSERDLCSIAEENEWYNPEMGVFMRHNGKLLGCFGIPYEHSQNNTIEDIIAELNQSHRVMVNANHAKLKEQPDIYNQACHAIIVTAIDDDFVFVINTASGVMDEKYRRETFLAAWKDSDYYLLSTKKTALYSYDIKSKTMKKNV